LIVCMCACACQTVMQLRGVAEESVYDCVLGVCHL
jgi:hypothetical protein